MCVCRCSLFRKNSRHAAPRARSSRSSFTELQTDASLPNSVQWPNEILWCNGNGADWYRILCFMRCCDKKGAKCQSLLVPSAAGHKEHRGPAKNESRCRSEGTADDYSLQCRAAHLHEHMFFFNFISLLSPSLSAVRALRFPVFRESRWITVIPCN